MIRARSLLSVLAAVAITFLARGEAIEIADGIAYQRGTENTTTPATGMTVVDLRFIAAPSTLPSWARDDRAARVVLLAGEDVPAWLTVLGQRSPRVLLLAPSGTAHAVDLSLEVSPDQVGAAVAAIDAGADVATLAQPIVAKRRFDESALVRRHHGEDASSPTDESAEEDRLIEAESKSPLSDPMLERAVQVLQGLRVLGRG